MQEVRLVSDWRKFLHEQPAPGERALTGDWADYDLCKPYICGGWMDLHHDTDYGATPEQPYFWIRARFWHRDGSLVITDEATGRFKIVSRTPEIIQFNGTKLHGFMPTRAAQELIERQDDEGPVYRAFWRRLRNAVMAPKLVWEWLDAEGKVKSGSYL